jgi:hypothetical protein
MKNPTALIPLAFKATLACLLLTMLSACTKYSLMNLQENLQTNVYQYNKRFDGKMMDLSSAFVVSPMRKDYLIDSNFIKEKVTIYERSILDMQYFDGDQLVKKTADGAEKEFNKAIVTLRYQISILPSNQLKTVILDQTWVLDEERWMVEPDLNVFLKK